MYIDERGNPNLQCAKMAGQFEMVSGEVHHDDVDELKMDHAEKHANVAKRKCTDIPCCLVFIASMVGTVLHQNN